MSPLFNGRPLGRPLEPASTPVPSQEWLSLLREEDPRLRLEGLWNLARRWEAEGNLREAVTLYSSLLRECDESPNSAEPLRARVQDRLDTLAGRGSLGGRTETLLRRFAQEAADPRSLLAMAVGGAVFRMTRLRVLASLGASPAPGPFSRGLGARSLASLAGLALEAPAFTLSARGLAALSGTPLDTSLGRDLASSYLVLGALKMGGAAAGAWTRGVSLENSWRGGLVRQGAALGGIALGHRLEETFGLAHRREGSHLLFDSLVTLLHFHVAGRLTHRLLGPGLAAWERSFDHRASSLADLREPPQPPSHPTPVLVPFQPRLAWAGAGEEPRVQGAMMSEDPRAPRGGSIPAEIPIRVSDLYMIVQTLPAALRAARPRIQYEGEHWLEKRDAAAIAGRLRRAIPLPPTKTLELTLLQQRRHYTFYWEGDLVHYRSRAFTELSELVAPEGPSAALSCAKTLPQMAAVLPRAADVAEPGASPAAAPAASERAGRPTLGSLSQHPLRTWSEYERKALAQIVSLAGQVLPAPISSPSDREESSALRGRYLARIANYAMLRGANTEATPTSFQPIEVAVQIGSHLENAYRHLDLGTIQVFQERTTGKALNHYSDALEIYNQGARRSGRRTLPSLGEMPLAQPGNYLIPRTESLRSALLNQIHEGRWKAEAMTLIPEMLGHPQALGRLHAVLLGPLMRRFSVDSQRLQSLVPGETLDRLLAPGREYRHEEARSLHAGLQELLQETPEISRLLVGGRGAFHRDYLRVLFFDATAPIRDVYPPYYSAIQGLPAELTGLGGGRLFLPTLGQVRDFTRVPSRPPRDG